MIALRRRAGRRGDHHALELDLDGQRHRRPRRQGRLCRRRRADAQSRSGRGGPQDHAAHQGDPAGPPVRAMLRHGRAGRTGPAARHPHRRGLRPRAGRRTIAAGRPASLGDIGVFSFHQQKNMVTLGEGGMVTTERPAALRTVALVSLALLPDLRSQGQVPADRRAQQPMGKRYWLLDFADVGYNYRMTEVQAAVGLVQLTQARRLQPPPARDRRRSIARGSPECRGLTLPYVAPDTQHTSSRLSACWSSRSFRCRRKTSCGSCTRDRRSRSGRTTCRST